MEAICPDEYAHSKDTKVLRGPNEYAKANASAAIKELIQIATNKTFSENHKDKHNTKAKYGWYRYDTRFAIPKYNDYGELAGYNIFKGRMVIRHYILMHVETVVLLSQRKADDYVEVE